MKTADARKRAALHLMPPLQHAIYNLKKWAMGQFWRCSKPVLT